MTSSAVADHVEFDPGSFRDRSGRVFYRDGRVFRAFDATAAREWQSAREAGFVQRLIDAGRIIRTEPAPTAVPSPDGDWAVVVEHDRIPFISYPYEWSFSMLRDAALLHLELLEAGLNEGITLKDATPFNVQFANGEPVFIDIASFVKYVEGEPWSGYRQFCQMFLYPLMLQAYRGIDLQPLLRGNLEGIAPDTMRRMLSFRDSFRPGVLTHVSLHARMQARFHVADRDTRQSLKSHGFGRELILANVRSLKRIVSRLNWTSAPSTWSEYETQCPHVRVNAVAKELFVRAVAAARPRSLVWDLGCNVGRFSRIAAEHADCVVAMDGDHRAIDDLYLRLRSDRTPRVLPLVVDLTDPSPARGWRGRERRDLPSRGRPDLVFCLALLHHLVIGHNILLPDVIDWFADLGADLVIEFVDKRDPQTQQLLRNKPDQYADYTLESFEQILSRRYHIRRRQTLPSGTRHLFHAELSVNGRIGHSPSGRNPSGDEQSPAT